MKIRFKVSMWKEIEIPKKYEKIIKSAAENGDIKSVEDLDNFIKDCSLETTDLIDETELLYPTEYDLSSTIKIYEDGQKNLLYKNGVY